MLIKLNKKFGFIDYVISEWYGTKSGWYVMKSG